MKADFDKSGRISHLYIRLKQLSVVFGGHEYALTDQQPPNNHYTNGFGRLSLKLEDGWLVFRGILKNREKKRGVATFMNKFREEKGCIRLQTRREWVGNATVYDDSLFFITRPLRFFSPTCNACRGPRTTKFWWKNRECKDCSTFKPWWKQFKVRNPHGIYYSHHGVEPRMYERHADYEFQSDTPIIRDYDRTKKYSELQVFTQGVKGAYAEMKGEKFGLRLEIFKTNCDEGQLRIVTARNHAFSEIEFQFANQGVREKGMVYTLDCRIRPMKY